jgi:telomerase reverse transcriptase
VALVTKSVIPKAFWGCDKNFRLILHRTKHLLTELWLLKVSASTDVKEFISCRRFETLSLHHILQGFSTSECDWLTPPGTAMRDQSRISVTDALKRRELLEEFIFWYFDSFVSSLLKVYSPSTYAV